MIRVISKSHENGSNEQIYFCTDKTEFKRSAEWFFLMGENESIDIDKIIECPELESLPFPTDRPLQAVN